MKTEVNGVKIDIVTELNDNSHDAVILVTAPKLVPVQVLEDFVVSAVQLDKALEKVPAVLHCPRVSGNRLVISPTGPLTDYDDVRSVAEAANKGIERAIQAGSKNPILVVQPNPAFAKADLVLLLGAFEALYVPIQLRELYPEKRSKLASLGLYGEGVNHLSSLLKNAVALEVSRGVARDIGGGDPERMTAARITQYLQELFQHDSVQMRVIDDVDTFNREYPLYAAVNRAANVVERHRGRIVFLEYNPGGHSKTIMLVGKGVTYDTGGCDIKAGGVMAGMSRDKCGAAAVAGFIKACVLLKPKIKVIGALALVRNSVGEDAYVADELIVSRNGKTVRVGNTDAEGRMAMGDLLAEMRERAANEKSPHIYSIATLTGHAHRTVGDGYTIVMDNHVAREKSHAHHLQSSGALVGDLLEISNIRREDFQVHRGLSGDDVLQALNKASVAVPRGHQGPAAFLMMVSGLDSGEVPYSHLDIAASAGSLPDPPTAAPVLALAQNFKLFN